MPNLKQYVQALIRQRDDLADNLTEQGVESSHTEKLNTLVPKVLEISGGGTPARLIEKTVTENGIYPANDDGANGYSKITVTVPSIRSLTPIDFDLMQGYVNGATWYPYSPPPGDTCADQYYLTAGKHYLIFLGATVGNRFRIAFFNQDVKTCTGNTNGTAVFSSDSPSQYMVASVFRPSTDGYLVIGKSNQSVQDIPTYVLAMEDVI